jgi:hypothetical protein
VHQDIYPAKLRGHLFLHFVNLGLIEQI